MSPLNTAKTMKMMQTMSTTDVINTVNTMSPADAMELRPDSSRGSGL